MKICQNVLTLDLSTLLKFCHGLPGNIQRETEKAFLYRKGTLGGVIKYNYAFLCHRLDLKRNSS